MGTLVNINEGKNQSVHLKARVMVRGEGIIVLLQWLWELRGSMQREGQAPRPTTSGWDSAVLEGLVRSERGGEFSAR